MSAADDFPEIARIPQGIGCLVIEDLEEQAARILDEVDRLRKWKAEASAVIGRWEHVWEALGRPGQLGESKAGATVRAIRQCEMLRNPRTINVTSSYPADMRNVVLSVQVPETELAALLAWLCASPDADAIGAESPPPISLPFNACPSSVFAGRQDRCGLFSHPARCTTDWCGALSVPIDSESSLSDRSA